MNYICLDVGNTRIKAGYFRDQGKPEIISITNENDLLQWLRKNEKETIYVSAVASPCKNILDEFNCHYPANEELAQIIPIRYHPISTLGTDRIFAMMGALSLVKNPVMVADAGTCLTIDIGHPQSGFLGGLIAPGLKMRLEAMHEKTARLPFIKNPEPISYPGVSTHDSMVLGSLGAMAAEILYLNQQVSSLGEAHTLCLSGGDASLLANQLKSFKFESPLILEENLVLYGLYTYASKL